MAPVLAASNHDAESARPTPGRLDEAAKSSFLRMISHELRTPLNSIIGFSEVLRQELCGPLGSDKYKEYAGYIGASGQKMLKLVNQIVEIVRLESQAEPMTLAPEPIEAALWDVVDGLQSEADACGVRIEARAPSGAPMVIVDARALRAVLTNLLQNALAYSPPDSVVRMHAWRAGPQVLVEISDDGPGFDPQDLPRLMRPFEQGEQALTRSADGAGLGLPIAQLLTEAMGGSLSIRTAQGAGLTATVGLLAG